MKKYILILLLSLMLFITSCNVKHIEDTNGNEDYSLCSLTINDIIKGVPTIEVGSIKSENGTKHNERVKKFSGVKNLLNIDDDEDRKVYIEFTVHSGNGVIAIVCNDSIYTILDANTQQSITLTAGQEYFVKVVGESCNYELTCIVN